MVSHPAITSALASWRAIRAEYQDYLEGRFHQADDELSGHLLNVRGRRAGVDPITLFYGPAVRVQAYASEDLKRWFAIHGRMNFEQYETERTAHTGRTWGGMIQEWDTPPDTREDTQPWNA